MNKDTIFQEADDNYEIDVPKEKRYLYTTSYDYSIQYLYELMRSNKICLEVPFQRKYIWKNDKSSSLMESIIMNVPIPPIYFAEEEEGKWLVVDGLQRLSSIKCFYENEYALTKLDVLTELNSKKYKDLPPKAKSLLDDGMIRVNVIRKDSHPEIKYDIFMRLNRGAVTLNYQELRNCMYRGVFNDTAKELCSENKIFLSILNKTEPDERYLDVEFIIRYFAFSDNIIKNENGEAILNCYKGRMVQFLNDYMESKKAFSQEDKIKYKTRFNSTIDKLLLVFDEEQIFRDITNRDNKKVFKSIADFLLPSFERMSVECINDNAEVIYQLLFNFLQKEEVRKSISQKTSDKDVVNFRLKSWFKELEDALSISL